MQENLALWNKVCKTDPKYTKNVTIGRSFTAIDPMYQVRKATEQFGVAGIGWGFEVVDKVFLPTDYAALTVRVWTGNRGNYIEHIGMCGLYMDKAKEKPDSDCIKKAMTDGITKGLSYFGFSADVFLGMFDDSRYVETLKHNVALHDKLLTIINGLETSKRADEFDKGEVPKKLRAELKVADIELFNNVEKAFKDKQDSLAKDEADLLEEFNNI